MADKSVTVVITGIGVLTSAGHGATANWNALTAGAAPNVSNELFAPYPVHPLGEVDWSNQIPKRGDQRQMENWQRIGTYAAGLALDDAGIKNDPALCASMDMIVAAAAGERDVDVDRMIMTKAPDANDREVAINEVLTTELRPTLFLAQLSNLLAGNISIVHKITGSSRTFMGEEGAGISAVMTAAARIRSGQGTHALVGGSFNAEHPDALLCYEVASYLTRGAWTPVWQRAKAQGGGIAAGSGGVFLVLEEREHAEARGAKIYACLDHVSADHGSDDKLNTLERLDALSGDIGLDRSDIIYSACSGGLGRTAVELEWLKSRLPETPVRAIGNLTGHLREAQFPLAVAFAALSLDAGMPIASQDTDHEAETTVKPEKIGVLALGYLDSEGVALLSRYEGES